MTQAAIGMSEPDSADKIRRDRAIRRWLLAVAATVFLIVIVGGATRLTESGLSITEWRPATGIIPPLTAEAWQAEFEKYQAIPQYVQRNLGMSLSAFKTIYWWEWTHRLLARAAGVVFAFPFLWFLWRRWIRREMVAPLALIFGLGALQGAVGWWMVASGLADRTEVSQYRLATHLLLASLIFAALIWVALGFGEPPPRHRPISRRVTAVAQVLVVLVLIQIYLGGLVAGLRAGLIYNTWPLIDGAIVPSAARLFFVTPLWRNIFENALTAQFDHRMVAYTLWIVAVFHALDVWTQAKNDPARQSALILAGAVTAQAFIGISTLLMQAPIDLALIHQAAAMIVLAIAVVHARSLSLQREPVQGRR